MKKILLAILVVLAVPASSQESKEGVKPPKTPLQLRAEKACSGFDKLKTEGEQRTRQRLLLALADTLVAEGFDYHASHCLERAGVFSYQFAEYDSAGAIFDRGLAVARRSKDPKRIAALLNAAANIVSIRGDDVRALELQRELIPLRESNGDPRGLAASWSGLAYSYQALYRIPEAIEAYRRALQYALDAKHSYGVALIRTSLAYDLFQAGRMEEALALADSGVVDCEREQAPALVGHAYESRGYMRHNLGRNEAALEDFERARAVFVDSGADRLAAGAAVNEASALVAVGKCREALALIDEAIPVLERTHGDAQRVAALATRGRALAACGDDGEAREQLRGALDELDEFRSALETEFGRAASYSLAGAAYTDLALLEDPADAWSIVEKSSGALMREKWGVESVDLAEFQAALGEIGATALQYSTATPEQLLVFVVTPDGVRRGTIRIPEGFWQEISTSLRLLASGDADDLATSALGRIATILLSEFDLSTERLVVIPGSLAGLPFEALPYGSAELGSRAAISYAPSATAFVHMQRRTSATSGMLAVADPTPADGKSDAFAVFDAMRSPSQPLPEARHEVERIAIPGALVIEGERATRSQVLGSIQDRGVLHFATHAVTDPNQPEDSSIVLAGSDQLDSREIEQLSIHADLVSLSGCSTANGYQVAGEGTLGLTRAFLVAGARSVVSSWWDVEDAAARHFMELFYGDLRRGVDVDLALRNARLTMADEGYPARDRLAFALVGASANPIETIANAGATSRRRWWIFLPIAVVLLSVLPRVFRARRAHS